MTGCSNVYRVLLWIKHATLKMKNHLNLCLQSLKAVKLIPPPFPGIFFVLPCIENYTKVDLRTSVIDIPPQEVGTAWQLLLDYRYSRWVGGMVFGLESVQGVSWNLPSQKVPTTGLYIYGLRNMLLEWILNSHVIIRVSVYFRINRVP